MPEPFEVHSYTIAALERLLAEKSRADAFIVSAKSHRAYFENYFARIGAKTIVFENHYVDRDFLNDFAEYYVRCFESYKRTCVRLHFFDIAFTRQDFADLLGGMNGSLNEVGLRKGYLGFIVVKPLPETIIGRTCLKTYPRAVGERDFPITRQYDVNLFGLSLTVNTLAFQEQDQVAAACATSALWSVFHGTGKLFQHPIPSPVEITKAATFLAPLDTRTLPDTHGLTFEQMAHAIRSVSLEPYPIRVNDEYVLKSTLYAYLQGRIPVLMGVHLAREIDQSRVHALSAITHASIGNHAVAVTGYNLGLPSAEPYGSYGFLLRAARIDRIYAHDDQVGPFARMLFDGVRVTLGDDEPSMYSLSTSWGSEGGIDVHRAIPTVVLIPLYHKIRIPFERVHDIVAVFDRFVEDLRQFLEQQNVPFLPQRLEWDIYLTTISDLKNNLLQSSTLASSYRLAVLVESMPRFIWRATARCNEEMVLDLLFDATDIEQGRFFLRAIEYHDDLSVVLHSLTEQPSSTDQFRRRPDWAILQWFKNHPRNAQ